MCLNSPNTLLRNIHFFYEETFSPPLYPVLTGERASPCGEWRPARRVNPMSITIKKTIKSLDSVLHHTDSILRHTP